MDQARAGLPASGRSMATPSRKRTGRTHNRLLDRLSVADFSSLTDEFESLRLTARQVLFQADDPLEHLYFPVSAVLSLIVPPLPPLPPNGQGIQIATVGNEGVVGFTSLLGVPTSFHQTICQVPGDCLRLPVPLLAEAMARRPAIDTLVKKYVAVAYRTVVQGVVCNALHQVEQRVCRWLLLHDKSADAFPATQDFLAARLGVRRPTVSLVANSLQKAGLISYHRGMIRIVDRAGLEQSACDCFKITTAVYERVMER
jgi:CRP-like cAMP-binding protein